MSSLFDYMCMRLPFIPWSIAGVPSSQVLPGFLITAPPSVCVPAVLGALAVWIQNQKKNGSCEFTAANQVSLMGKKSIMMCAGKLSK